MYLTRTPSEVRAREIKKTAQEAQGTPQFLAPYSKTLHVAELCHTAKNNIIIFFLKLLDSHISVYFFIFFKIDVGFFWDSAVSTHITMFVI